MKRVLSITALCVLAVTGVASAQTAAASASTRKLADVAREEEARRKGVREPAKVYTNIDLIPDTSRIAPPPPSTAAATDASANATPSNGTPAATPAETPAAEKEKPVAKDQAYWSGRIKAARTDLSRAQLFAESLQSRINALNTDYVNRDDRVQREQIDVDRKTALSELERVKREVEEHAKIIRAIEDEARRAGVPAGWLRH